jgi:hypothetical protein
MGAWGSGPFDNDFAADWAYELEAADGFGAVLTALTSVVGTSGFLDAFDGSIALAAAEVAAAARGRPTSSLPKTISAWVAQHSSELTGADEALALAAVDRVLAEDSELRELWAESSDSVWLDAAQELRHRLAPG